MNNEINNIVTITDENNNVFDVEVLDIFNVSGYEGKDYILYTMNEEVDQDNVKVYVSILEQNGDGYILKEITNENELKDVDTAIKEMGE